MSDTFPANWPPALINAEFTHKASVLAEIGDLLYFDFADPFIKPASSMADLGTAALQQAEFASTFAGVSLSKQLATDATARNARVQVDGVWEFPCASATFEVGDYVTPTYSTNILLDQELTKTTDPTLAIGKVVKRYASATTKVKCRLTSALFMGLVRDGAAPPVNPAAQVGRQGAPTAKTTAVTLTAAELLTGIITGTHAAGATQAYTLPTGTLMSGATPAFVDGMAFDWTLINLSAAAADTITLTAATDHTIVGNPIVQSSHATTGGIYGNSARWRTRKSTGITWITYRIG